MVESVEDKDFLAARLEQDRQKMALQVSELKKDYNLARRLRTSVQRDPWPWLVGAAIIGFLVSWVPARRKEVYLPSDPVKPRSRGEARSPGGDQIQNPVMNKIWSLAKPIISTYIGRELYNYARRLNKRVYSRAG
jgi:hypothetical protein